MQLHRGARGASPVNHDEEYDRFGFAGINEGVGDIGPVAGGIARADLLGIARGLNAQSSFLDCEEFTSAFEMRGTAQSPTRLQAHFVELDILFQVQRGEGANPAIFVGTVMVGVVVGSNHRNRGRG